MKQPNDEVLLYSTVDMSTRGVQNAHFLGGGGGGVQLSLSKAKLCHFH